MRIPQKNKAIHNKSNIQPSMPNRHNTKARGNAASVPAVPGATGDKPLPKPNPKKHNGLCNSQEKVGLRSAKMIKS
jgi:hypothetical protein